jgi:type IV pilus assembly protein PilF
MRPLRVPPQRSAQLPAYLFEPPNPGAFPMTMPTLSPLCNPHVQRGLCVALALVALVLHSGCATPAGGPGTEIVTESDETEARKRARTRLALAVGYFEQGQTTIALDELKLALQADPAYGDAFNVRGLIYMRLGDMRLAEESFRRAIALNPRDGNVLHNLGWMQCQQNRLPEAFASFDAALANPTYGDRSKTLLTKGLCEIRAGRPEDAERSLQRSYELDAGNPVAGFHIANLSYKRGDYRRAQFYIRRLNNSEFANNESLWLGIRVERRLDNREAMLQLADQLKRRFPQSPELASYERGQFTDP